METQATILHADLDAFYASVEQLMDPSLRGRPIAVGGGVVLAASYEAKAFGVRGGMSGRAARELCPDLVFVGGHFGDYQRLGDAAIAVLGDFTPLVERISIDEAFADVAGCTHLFGSPAEIAAAIRRRVRAELGLPISVGVARTKHLAKIASQVAKPDGIVVVDPAKEIAFLHDLPVELMWGVGPVTRAKLADQGILTIGQLAAASPRSLERLLGQAQGEKLHALAWNRDPRRIRPQHRARSAGAQSALGRQPATEAVFRPALRHLADRVASRLRAKHLAGRTVTVRVRFADMRAVTRSVTLDAPISATTMLAEIAEDLVRVALADHPRERIVTLLAISVSHLGRQSELQLELPLGLPDEKRRPGTRQGAARWSADRAMDAIRARFGRRCDRLRGRSRSTGGVRCRTRSGNSPRRTSAARSDERLTWRECVSCRSCSDHRLEAWYLCLASGFAVQERRGCERSCSMDRGQDAGPDVPAGGRILDRAVQGQSGRRRRSAPTRCRIVRWRTSPTGPISARRPSCSNRASGGRLSRPHLHAERPTSVRGHPTLGTCHAWLAAGGQPRGDTDRAGMRPRPHSRP